MVVTIVLSSIVFALIIAGILFFPVIRIGKVKLDSYWVIALFGAVVVVLCSPVEPSVVGGALVADTAVNPLKLLALFVAMTALSVFLDELGFFKILAMAALKRAGVKQFRLFLFLYLLVSILTVFTSNDIIILSFTPFICYFAKSAKIDSVPYLAAEFVAANTWSIALIIGNPTNIYLASAAGIGFAEYVKYSFIPTIFGGVTAFLMLFLMFRKKLAKPLECEPEPVVATDKLLLEVGIVHLAAATVLLAISSYIHIEMWIAAVCAALGLFVFALVCGIVRRKKPVELIGCIRRLPYNLVPFVLSMFVIIVTLDGVGVTARIGELIGGEYSVFKYGVISFFAANVINNIPMSVLFSSVIASGGAGANAVYATIIGSNICAFFTPIGALAGIMWSSLINEHGVKFGYVDFLAVGGPVAIPTLAAALGGLELAFLFF